ncbi:glycosyltransferase family 4 protein [Ulvibacterium marinum]|uniref:glycosyltransferase family 4 protein n=1 Tax=Ulvibacterium marinum TaxID=2419782 RepID=UPI002493DE57|nr:glycosyltransferase family 4 protein [Ulvibacterium marinum]
MKKQKIVRITTIPESLGSLLKGQLRFMVSFYDVLGVSSSGNGILNEIGEAEGVRVIPIEMTRKITPLKDLKAVWQLYRVLKHEKPFIVHSHTPKAGTIGMLSAFLARVPHRLHTIAGLPLLEATGKKRWLLDMVERLTYKCATKIYPNSFGLKEIILKNGYTSNNKLEVIGNGSSNGIDTNYFDPNLFNEGQTEELKKELGIKKNDFVYVFVGRLVKDKGINELVEAFKRIAAEFKNTRLLLVGSYENNLDPLLPETENFINNSDQVIAPGWQRDVRPYFAISHCLVFPSYREGFPNVVMQAGAMGLKSIATDINGCNEIIINGENGDLIPPKDKNSLFEAMKAFYLQTKLQSNDDTADKCRKLIVERYSQKHIWNAILREYQALETM